MSFLPKIHPESARREVCEPFFENGEMKGGLPMETVNDKLGKRKIALTRRSLVGLSAAAAAAAVAGCAPKAPAELAVTSTAGKTAVGNSIDQRIAAGEGEWKPVACWHDCGGRCKNYALFLDGVPVRQKSDDSHEDSLDYPQLRGCIRGRSQRKQVMAPDRLRYPMKRKGWQPGGGDKSGRELRGRDEWERISWDEAFALMAEEILRVNGEFGPASIITYKKDSPSLNALGGCTKIFDTRSFGSVYMNMNLLGLPLGVIQSGNDRYDLPNADTVILYSSNAAWSSPGFPVWLYQQAKEKGVTYLSVGPEYNATAQMLDADWVPVRTGTDTALLLGVAHEMLRLDEEEGDVVDWDFLHTFCVGFDAESMPADASVNENFKDYVLGVYDGIPKTAEWASSICGTPVDRIVEFARTNAKTRNVMWGFGLAAFRTCGAEYLPQLMMTLACMGGHIGKSGNCFTLWEHPQGGNFGPKLVLGGKADMPRSMNPVEHYVPAAQAWRLIAEGGGAYSVVHAPYGFGTMLPGTEMTLPEIKGIMHIVGNNLQNMTDMNMGIKAHRTVDFVFTRAHFFNADARYSDIVLPLTTKWEDPGIIIYDGNEEEASRENLFCYQQVMDPLFECKSDQQIEVGLMKALGVDPLEYYPKDERQQFFEQICTSTVMGENGEYEPLVEVTQADLDKWGYEAELHGGRITIDELISNGSYQVQRAEGDAFGNIGFEAFVADPVANPLPSASGKFEIYCQAQADTMNTWGQDDTVFKPYPVYQPAPVGWESTFVDGDINGEKGEFPLVGFTAHYLRRSHGIFDNIPWLREVWENPAFISRADAEERGIETGDTVLISSRAGKILRHAQVIDTLMPGVLMIPHGSWPRLNEETGIDEGGCDQFLTSPTRERSVFGTYNSLNLQIEKYSASDLPADVSVETESFFTEE